MNPLARVYHLPVRRRTRTPLITVAQFAELMAAISSLPDPTDDAEGDLPL